MDAVLPPGGITGPRSGQVGRGHELALTVGGGAGVLLTASGAVGGW